MRGLSRKVLQHLALPWRIEVFKPRMASPGCAQNVVLQGLQQRALAAAAQQEIRAGLQVFLQLATSLGRRCLDRAVAHACLPQPQGSQRNQGDEGLGEITEQQGKQIVRVSPTAHREAETAKAHRG